MAGNLFEEKCFCLSNDDNFGKIYKPNYFRAHSLFCFANFFNEKIAFLKDFSEKEHEVQTFFSFSKQKRYVLMIIQKLLLKVNKTYCKNKIRVFCSKFFFFFEIGKKVCKIRLK